MDDFVIWTAGFFDGEGCVMFKNQPRGGSIFKPELTVTISQRERLWLTPIQMRWGGSVNRDRTCWCFHIKTLAAEKFLREIVPYVRVKRDQVDVALELRDLMHNRLKKGKGSPHVPKDRRNVEQLMHRLVKLKKAV